MIFDPITINNVTFANRLLRSSVGGRSAYYNGTASDVWKNFEKRFAEGGVGGIISTTLNINRYRQSPVQYPPISEDRFVPPLRKYIREIRATGVKYLIQIGDPGMATQVSLFPEVRDSWSSSSGFDLAYGYNNWRTPMTEREVLEEIAEFRDAARRVRETGADGVEVTASKGYIIHQFLNPGLNRRTDEWGGTPEKRFRLLEEIVKAVRAEVGRDFLFGIRLSAADWNFLPLNVRLPIVFPLRAHFFGNGIEQTLEHGRWLKALGIDFLHIDSGYGFLHPRVTPGRFPLFEARLFCNHARHLSAKVALQATLFNLLPRWLLGPIVGIGYRYKQGISLDYAATFRREIGLPVISNGGFQHRGFIEQALADGKCDMVSMARALLANPDLPKRFREGFDQAERPCTFCSRCAGRTATSPLGCYEPLRFDSIEDMERQIMEWNRPDPV